MKSRIPLLITAFSTVFFASCNLFDKKDDKNKLEEEEKAITKVDVTIDTSNSFNSLFIDSFTVRFILAKNELDDTLTNRIKSFYNSRNYQYAWFSKEGLPEHTISFWNLLKNYLNYSKDSSVYHQWLNDKMERLISIAYIKPKNDSLYQNLEILLTRYFYTYSDHAYRSNPNFTTKSLEWYIPKKKLTLESMLDSVLSKNGQYADEYAPHNPQYLKLRDQLLKYKQIKDNGGWPVVNSKVEVMTKGYSDAAVKTLKLRLKIEGFLNVEDSMLTNLYDSELADAVNELKKTYGYKPDGTAGRTFLKDVNIPLEERIQQILINMERMRWLPGNTADSGRSIMVNIPEFRLHVYEYGQPAWNMDVVVGKEGNNTTVFTGRLSNIVFSPYWNVPSSIVKNEMHGKPSAAYLARNHMEIIKGRVRQKPGPWNSLGLVKFLFPNSYNIYFHDSPAKSLFNRDKRSYSHGCIRLKEPAKLAAYILNDTVRYSAKKVDSLMRTYKEKYIRVKKPIPVLITYFTSWVNDSSVLNFREDIYGHDAIIAKKMFLNSVGTSYSRQKAIRDSIQRVKDLAKRKDLHRKDSIAKQRKRDSLRRVNTPTEAKIEKDED
ncbi:L,D-transpeptidase family protein [Niabella ginsengisoli]|uniref:L,D-transpeptidase family protein n=1 Tax=Niabella ginsengisoli TaxID=522298 RepID=A0ABS9SJK4_9BACT|nr:L,D-transpeptidase family protein [Niabella ginsengisoli]MCH5598530.1 L,D-transpeptidase family protein [Niabella ginsengisoli]